MTHVDIASLMYHTGEWILSLRKCELKFVATKKETLRDKRGKGTDKTRRDSKRYSGEQSEQWEWIAKDVVNNAGDAR
jgi:hypothetical protein